MNEAIHRRELLGRTAVLMTGAVGGAAGASRVLAQAEVSRPPATSRKMKLGLVTYNIASDWDLPTVIDRCRKLKLAAVELRTTHKHGVEPGLSKAERADVRKRFADAGIALCSLGSTCEYHDPDPVKLASQIETTKQFIDLAKDLGANGVKVRPNGLPEGVAEEKTLEQIGKALATCGRAAADAGIEILLEVHGSGTSHPPRIRKMLDIADRPNVGATWNSNATDLKDGSVRPYFELLRDKIRSVHINELTSGYPYRELFGLLNLSGYDRYTLIEVQNLRTRNADPADVMRFLQYYVALWNELSTPTPV